MAARGDFPFGHPPPKLTPKIACPQPLEAPQPVPHQPRSPKLAGASLLWPHGYYHRRRPSSGHPGFNQANPKVALVSLMLPHLSSLPGSTPSSESSSLSFLCSKNRDQGLHTTIEEFQGPICTTHDSDK
jgi:hypothetical protein